MIGRCVQGVRPESGCYDCSESRRDFTEVFQPPGRIKEQADEWEVSRLVDVDPATGPQDRPYPCNTRLEGLDQVDVQECHHDVSVELTHRLIKETRSEVAHAQIAVPSDVRLDDLDRGREHTFAVNIRVPDVDRMMRAIALGRLGKPLE
jgi:hypothetical protein